MTEPEKCPDCDSENTIKVAELSYSYMSWSSLRTNDFPLMQCKDCKRVFTGKQEADY